MLSKSKKKLLTDILEVLKNESDKAGLENVISELEIIVGEKKSPNAANALGVSISVTSSLENLVAKYQDIFRTVGLPSVLFDINGKLVSYNTQFLAFSGYEQTELSSKYFGEVFDTVGEIDFLTIINQFIAGFSSTFRIEYKLVKNDGSKRVIEAIFSKATTDGQDCIGVIGLLLDKAEIRYVGELLSKRENHLLGLNELLDKAFLEHNVSNIIQGGLESLLKAIGADRIIINQVHYDNITKDPLFSKYSEHFSEIANNTYFAPVIQSVPFAAYFPTLFEDMLLMKDYSVLFSDAETKVRNLLSTQGTKSIFITPVHIAKDLWGFVSVESCSYEKVWTQDEIILIKTFAKIIAKTIELENYKQESAAAKAESEQAFKLRSTFLTNMSHEFRTPIQGITSYSEIIIDEVQDSYFKSMAEHIQNSARRLMHTLNSILDLSSLETSSLYVNYIELDVAKVVRTYINNYETDARNKGIELISKIPKTPVIAKVDEKMFGVIAGHLISNAIKFTDKGSVSVTVEYQHDGEKFCTILSVQDTGIGIDEKNRELIFKEFRQISEGYDRRSEGLGIGLTLISNFVKMLNAELTLDSEPGKGSTFTVKFRREDKDIFEETDTTKNDKSSLVLLVEDDEISRQVIKTCLKDICTLEIARDGATALRMARQKQYKVILMDINLGREMNGMDVTRRLRKQKEYADTPIVAVTAFAMQGDREEFLAAGCSHYIAKPFEKVTLLNLLKQYI